MSKSWQYWVAVVAVAALFGCSKSTPETTPAPASNGTAPTTSQSQPVVTGQLVTSLTPASEVVALFLESLKKGDANQTRSLLTQTAQQEIERRGLSIDPIGSAESTFKIGRTQFSDQDADAAYVEAEWTEPIENNQTMKTDVVFTVHLESNAWRISGMAIDMGADAAPVLVDFENMADTIPGVNDGEAKSAVAAKTAPATQSPVTQAPAAQTASIPAQQGFAVPPTAPQQSIPDQSGFSMPPQQVAQPPVTNTLR